MQRWMRARPLLQAAGSLRPIATSAASLNVTQSVFDGYGEESI